MGATTFAMTTMFMITSMNNLGQLAPVEKGDLPPSQSTVFFFNEEGCNLVRGKMANPQKYVCQAWRGQAAEGVPVLAPAQPQPAPEPKPAPQRLVPETPPVNNEIEVHGQQYKRVAGFAWVPVEEETPSSLTTLQPKPKKVAKRAQQQQLFDPLGAFVSLFTPRSEW
jgi:hypothetical protein